MLGRGCPCGGGRRQAGTRPRNPPPVNISSSLAIPPSSHPHLPDSPNSPVVDRERSRGRRAHVRSRLSLRGRQASGRNTECELAELNLLLCPEVLNNSAVTTDDRIRLLEYEVLNLHSALNVRSRLSLRGRQASGRNTECELAELNPP
jgi:hypothetical protein